MSNENRATDIVDLWLSNDRCLYEQAMEYGAQAASSEHPRADLADWLEDLIRTSAERDVPELFESGNFVNDLYGYALSSVDWFDLADRWLENVRESERFSA